LTHAGGDPGQTHLIRLTGELQMATVPLARRRIWSGLEPAHPLILDLGGVSFLDSAGLGLLLCLHREVTRRGGRWAIVGASEPVTRLLAVTHADRLLPIFATSSEAERAWRDREPA
jgi:anti-anti-sigma factor